MLLWGGHCPPTHPTHAALGGTAHLPTPTHVALGGIVHLPAPTHAALGGALSTYPPHSCCFGGHCPPTHPHSCCFGGGTVHLPTPTQAALGGTVHLPTPTHAALGGTVHLPTPTHAALGGTVQLPTPTPPHTHMMNANLCGQLHLLPLLISSLRRNILCSFGEGDSSPLSQGPPHHVTIKLHRAVILQWPDRHTADIQKCVHTLFQTSTALYKLYTRLTAVQHCRVHYYIMTQSRVCTINGWQMSSARHAATTSGW